MALTKATYSMIDGALVNVLDYGAVGNGVADDTAAIQAALASLDTSGGRGATLFLPVGAYLITAKITVPARVKIIGAGPLSTIVNTTFAGAAFELDGISDAGVSDLRIGFGPSASIIGINIKTTSASCQRLIFRNLFIAGASVAGQRGIQAVASGGRIIAECRYQGIDFVSVDRPVKEMDTEGNYWSEFAIDQYGYGVSTAFESQGLGSFYQGRIAGAPTAGSVGYAQTGIRNFFDIVTDIGASSTALNIAANGKNIGQILRPELLTPLGTVGSGNTVIDSELFIARRIVPKGATPTSANFTISAGWGSTATVDTITGNDMFVQFQILSNGTGQTANPTVSYTYADGAFDIAPNGVSVDRNGGNQPSVVATAGRSAGTTTCGFTWVGTPVATEGYVFTMRLG